MAKHRSDTYFVSIEHEGSTHLLSFRAMYSHFPVLDDAYFGCLMEPESELVLDCGFHEFPNQLRERFEGVLTHLGTILLCVPSVSPQNEVNGRWGHANPHTARN